VGKIRVSEDEIARMPFGSAQLYSDGDGYAGVLEVFHELHCLVSGRCTQQSMLPLLLTVNNSRIDSVDGSMGYKFTTGLNLSALVTHMTGTASTIYGKHLCAMLMSVL
jgi:hypothetical protein